MQPVFFQFIVLEAFIHFIRYIVIQRLMKPRRVVEVEVGINAGLRSEVIVRLTSDCGK